MQNARIPMAISLLFTPFLSKGLQRYTEFLLPQIFPRNFFKHFFGPGIGVGLSVGCGRVLGGCWLLVDGGWPVVSFEVFYA